MKNFDSPSVLNCNLFNFALQSMVIGLEDHANYCVKNVIAYCDIDDEFFSFLFACISFQMQCITVEDDHLPFFIAFFVTFWLICILYVACLEDLVQFQVLQRKNNKVIVLNNSQARIFHVDFSFCKLPCLDFQMFLSRFSSVICFLLHRLCSPNLSNLSIAIFRLDSNKHRWAFSFLLLVGECPLSAVSRLSIIFIYANILQTKTPLQFISLHMERIHLK